MFRVLVYYFSAGLSKLFFPCTVKGFENLPKEGGFIIASNHRSYLDPVIMGVCNRQWLSYMAKEELFRSKFLNFSLRSLGAFPIKRGKTDVGALKEAIRRLNSGSPLLVFPEGTRKQGLAVDESQSGIGFLAAKTNVPVVPAYVEGSDRALPPGAKFFHRHRVILTFGRPKTYSKAQSYPEISKAIMRQIQELISA